MIFKLLSNFCDFLSKACTYLRAQVFARTCRSTALLTGKTAIITGGNAGIGKEVAFDLANRGAKVIIACRDTEKGNQVAQDIRQKVNGADIIVKHLDLASLASVRIFSEDVLKAEPFIHLLINNAGIAACSKSITKDGFEMQLGVNHLGHFLLTNLLLDRMKESAPARIVNVASVVHIIGKIDFNDLGLDQRYHPFAAYCRSKLANVLFTRHLSKKLEGSGVTTYSLHPGYTNTEMGRYISGSMSRFSGCFYNTSSKMFFLSTRKGAQTVIHCAVDETVALESGFYYCNCRQVEPSASARDDELAKKFWDVSEKLVNLTTTNETI